MTPMDLALECKRVIEAGNKWLCLVIPGPPPRGERIRLDRRSRKRCPMGEVADWTDTGTVAYFAAVDVLAWLMARGMVDVIVAQERP